MAGTTKDFIRPCHIDDEDTEPPSRSGRAAVHEYDHAYSEWLRNVGGITVEAAPRPSAADAATAVDLGSSPCSPPSVPTAVRAQFPSDGFGSPSSRGGITSQRPVYYCCGCTPRPTSGTGDQRRPGETSASELATTSPMPHYYMGQQQTLRDGGDLPEDRLSSAGK